jgi:hypothetical protein
VALQVAPAPKTKAGDASGSYVVGAGGVMQLGTGAVST